MSGLLHASIPSLIVRPIRWIFINNNTRRFFQQNRNVIYLIAWQVQCKNNRFRTKNVPLLMRWKYFLICLKFSLKSNGSISKSNSLCINVSFHFSLRGQLATHAVEFRISFLIWISTVYFYHPFRIFNRIVIFCNNA